MGRKIAYWGSTAIVGFALLGSLSYLTGNEQVVSGFAKAGYPQHLRREEIPQCGRIVALADVFDALTHSRPYKEAWPLDRAVDEVHRLRGRRFDPEVVEAFDQLEAEQLAETDLGDADHLGAAS